jgi:hypothetical protein
MLEWLAVSWHKLLIVYITIEKVIERVQKFRVVTRFIERRIGLAERRHTMTNPIADIQLALTILAQVRAGLPVAAKAIVDIKQAWVDKADPTKASADLAQVLTDLEPLINQLLALVPPPPAA